MDELSYDKKVIYFEQLYLNYHGRLVLYANKYLHDVELAKDVVQEVFSILWRQQENRVLNGNTKAYLFQAVRNKALNCIRDNKKYLDLDISISSQLNQAERMVVADASNPFHSLLELELEEQFDAVLNRLPESCVKAFKLSRNEGLKNREIADRMGVSVKMVEKHISKALHTFRKEFAQLISIFF